MIAKAGAPDSLSAMRWVFYLFLLLYAVALSLLAVGTFGWFGQDRDPLSGVFLIPLGLPSVWLGDEAGLTGPALAILAPAINAGILYWVWKH